MTRKILILANNYWTSPYQVGSHHIARLFLKDGWKVAYISDPISPLHLIKGTDFLEKWKIYRKPIVRENFISYVPFTLFPPKLCKNEFLFEKWINFTFPNLLKFLKEISFDEVDILFFNSALFSELLNKVKHNISIYRVADFNPAFPGFSSLLVKKEIELIKNVDIVLSSAKATIVDYILKYRRDRVYYLPNGVEVELFLENKHYIPEDIKKIPKPIAMYVGSINKWFDKNLLEFLLKNLSNISFVLIGKIERKDIVDLREKYNNLYLFGPKNYKNIANYMKSANVALMLQDISNSVTHYFNPLKLYQYLACGIPVVSMKWKNLEYINPPIFLSENYEEYVMNVKKALSVTYQDRQRYIEFAKKYDWDKIFLKLKEILESFNA